MRRAHTEALDHYSRARQALEQKIVDISLVNSHKKNCRDALKRLDQQAKINMAESITDGLEGVRAFCQKSSYKKKTAAKSCFLANIVLKKVNSQKISSFEMTKNGLRATKKAHYKQTSCSIFQQDMSRAPASRGLWPKKARKVCGKNARLIISEYNKKAIKHNKEVFVSCFKQL